MVKFHEMGLDDRLLKAIAKLGWSLPTLIQEKAVPLLLEGKDVLCRARTGSGKTGAFALPLLQKILALKGSAKEQGVRALVIAPSKELSHQIHRVLLALTYSCSKDVRVIDLTATSEATVKSVLQEKPDVLVGTPTKVLSALKRGYLPDLKSSLDLLVLDEADLLFSFGYEDDLKALLPFFPPVMQTVLCSATLSEDVLSLKGLFLTKSPVILKLEEPLIPPSTQLAHYVIRAEEEDKFVLIYALFKLRLVRGKSLVFVNTVDRSYKLKLYLEQFGISSCVLNSELPEMSRWHTVAQFNSSHLYNVIIASDDRILDEEAKQKDGQKKAKKNEEEKEEEVEVQKKRRRKDKESGVSRGIDFQALSNVINFDFPLDANSYLHRVGRTARGNNQGSALSFVSLKEEELQQEVESLLGTLSTGGSDLPGGVTEAMKMRPFNFKMTEVEGFRYRAKDALKAVTRIAIREARLKEIKVEIMNSSKLKSYFDTNPGELRALRHDKALRTVKQQPHLRNVPDYIVPKTLKHLPIPKGTGSSHTFTASSRSQRKRKFNSGASKGHLAKRRKADPLQSMEFKGMNKKKNKNKRSIKDMD